MLSSCQRLGDPLGVERRAPATRPRASNSPECSGIALPRTPRRQALFTWTQLCDIISTGRLHDLRRHPDDVEAYSCWRRRVESVYGTVQRYILERKITAPRLVAASAVAQGDMDKPYFHADMVDGRDCQVLLNDWPYSVPEELLPDGPIKEQSWTTMRQRGLCGTISGAKLATPGLESFPDLCSSATAKAAGEVVDLLRGATMPLVDFIRRTWDLSCVDVAFFANPPRLQSVPQLPHFHVLVRERGSM
ncbi:uncharacterized protein PFL1_06613 [Pseudozyma flocculosa PF-1]|uniref:Uncharacterized protein n=2 Tax=Pseudozyma flocculosa TaxID=84751 RepID=A0A5C3FB48_9BASI|nr:uncharacterized protein PFL1_06613 [Pseudozyma flocculosa PF-1]EPQ25746.1 hypothetical protein PFL1_06613 [Pseudozyma flocculosa PF-1]SPO40559.1 uncharacterized protein PSFLO_06041 [Pseudozyma flocculosa]